MANPFIAPCTTTLTDHRQEKDLICPYNHRHFFKVSSMQKHLIKCRMGHPSGGKATCPYDKSHVMPMIELEVHKAFCASRFLAPQSKSTFEPRTESLSSIPIKTREFEPSEDWDLEECPTYDPSTRVMTGDLRVLPNMARFEKDSKPLVPISVNCRLAPPVRNQKDDARPSSSMNVQVGSPHAEPRRNRHYDSPPSCRLGPPVRNQKDDARPSSSKNVQEFTPHAESRRNRHYDSPPSCRLSPPVRNQKDDARPSSSMNAQEARRNRHYDPPPRFAAARSDRLYSSESSRYEPSRQHQSHDSVPKPKTRQYPNFRDDQSGPSRYFPMPHKRM